MRQEAGGSSPSAPPPPACYLPSFLPSFRPSFLGGGGGGGESFRLSLCTSSSTSFSHSSSLVLLLLLFEQFVDLPLGHGRVLADDAMLVQAGQQQQEAHCGAKVKGQDDCILTALHSFSDSEASLQRGTGSQQMPVWLCVKCVGGSDQ